VPYADRAEAERRLGAIPDGLELDFYRADGDEWPGTAGEVAFYVLPYMKGTAVLDKVPDMPRLEVVQTLTAGYEDVLPLLPDRVTLCNAAGLHDTSTAELALSLALASGRHLDWFARDQVPGTWDQRPGRSLADQRVLIVGYGHVGSAIEARLQGFEVASVTRVSRRGRTGPPPVHPFSDLPALLPEADVVFVVAPHTPETEGLFGARNCRTARCWSTWPAASWSTPEPCWPSCRPGGSPPRLTLPIRSRSQPATRCGTRPEC
jgi:lactate dehydrogenase-like 2-hydroxyacid dehydrogenase